MGVPAPWAQARAGKSPTARSSSTISSPTVAQKPIDAPSDLAPFPAADEIRHRTELNRVKDYFANKSQTEVLMYCIGMLEFPDAPELAKSTIVICFDTEGWNANSSIITEVGFCTFESQTMRTVEPGAFGENILKNTYFYHIRVSENAHLRNLNAAAGDPERNRFGKTKFLTETTTKLCLEDAFRWPVDPEDLSKGVCPVTMLGHALENDRTKLQDLLAFEPDSHGQIVKEMDTQVIARELDYWNTPKNQVGLRHMVTKLGFEYRDAHTASNDAAMTMIAAVLLVLPTKYYTDQPKPIQRVINEVEQISKTQPFDYGSDKYCFRCQRDDHMEEYPDGTKCNVPVLCTLCHAASVKDPRRKRSMYCHLASACIWHGLKNGNSVIAQARREAKQREAERVAGSEVTFELAELSVNGDARRRGRGNGRAGAAQQDHSHQGRARHLARGGAAGFLSRGIYISGVSGRQEHGQGYPGGVKTRGRGRGGFRSRGGYGGRGGR